MNKKAAEAIKKGKVIVCPTDTVYGLVCDATNRKAIDRLFKIKKRPKNKFVPIFVKNIKKAKELAEIDKKQEDFLRSVWPGKVTVVLKRKKTKFKLYGVGEKTIALRIPDHQLIAYLLSVVDLPLTGTSANISGRPASTRIKEVLKQFENEKYQPDFIIDSGNLKLSKPSKIIDLTGSEPKVLR